MRRLQHQLRLQGQDNARIEPKQVEVQAAHVKRLRAAMFG